jgi:predicted nucleic acid-binding protein
VTVVLDTAVVLALYDRRDQHHAAASEWAELTDEELVTSPLALAEMDYVLSRRGGEVAQQALWRDLDRGAFTARWWADALSQTLAIARRHPFAGLTDASLVALAGLLRTNRIATFDDHFRSMTTPRGEAFVVLPADA